MTTSTIWISLLSLATLCANPLVAAAECASKFTGDDADWISVERLEPFGEATAKTICMPDSNNCMEFATLYLKERMVAPPGFDCVDRVCTRMCEGHLEFNQCQEPRELDTYGKVSQKTVCMTDSDSCMEFTTLRLAPGVDAPPDFDCNGVLCTRAVTVSVPRAKSSTRTRYGISDTVEVGWKCASILILLATVSYAMKTFINPT